MTEEEKVRRLRGQLVKQRELIEAGGREAARAYLVETGIYNPDGTLNDNYKHKPINNE